MTMTDDDVLRAFRSVGFAAFVSHLDPRRCDLGDPEPTPALERRTGWAVRGFRTRVNRARLS